MCIRDRAWKEQPQEGVSLYGSTHIEPNVDFGFLVFDNVKTNLYKLNYWKQEAPPAPEVLSSDDDALFLSLQGKRMTERQIRELVKKYTSIALHTSRKGGYSPHKLRATAATSLIGRGNSIYDVAALLDHEQVTTTQLYARHKADVKRDLVKDMEWEEERKK